jgi:hypothetical protein
VNDTWPLQLQTRNGLRTVSRRGGAACCGGLDGNAQLAEPLHDSAYQCKAQAVRTVQVIV